MADMHTPLVPCPTTEFERRSLANTIHGHTRNRQYSPTYHSWQAMLARCRWATPTQQARNRRNKRLDFSAAVEVALARLRGEECKSIAARFSISESLPREIVKGRTWPDASKLAHTIRDMGANNG